MACYVSCADPWVVSVSYGVNDELLNCLQRLVAILTILVKVFLRGLGSWFALTDILGAVINHSTSWNNVLHIYKVELRSLASRHFLLSGELAHLQSWLWSLVVMFGVPKATHLFAMVCPKAVGFRASCVPLACGNELGLVFLAVCNFQVGLVADVWLADWLWCTLHITANRGNGMQISM